MVSEAPSTKKKGFVMDKPLHNSENEGNSTCTNRRVGSPELHPLMAVSPPISVVELNRSNSNHRDTSESNAETFTNLPLRGIDDGFLTPGNAEGGNRESPEDESFDQPASRGGGPRERETPGDREPPVGNFPVSPNFPYYPNGPQDPNGHIPRGRGGVDINVYAHKKTLAQGMMDLALLSANANQLRYVLDSGPNHPYFYVGIVLISTSIALQLAVGVGLIINSRYNIRHLQDVAKANFINNFTVLGVFFVTMLNVFISAFGVGDVASTPAIPGDSGPPDRLVTE